MKIFFENEIAIAVVLKNEATYIDEWIEYHYKIGVDKIYLYDNDSEDRSELMNELKPWIDLGVVEYNELPGDYAQLPAYQDAMFRHRFDCRYMAFIDVDEFIVPKNGRDLIDILNQAFEKETVDNFTIGGLTANWRVFASGGKPYRELGGVIERFTMRTKDEFDRNLMVKTITNPRRIDYYSNPHHPQYYINVTGINENGNQVLEYQNTENTVDKIQINHYFTKSKEEFIQKMSRGRADCYLRYSENTFLRYDMQETVEDLTALEIFQQPTIRREKIVDEESTIRDLEFMLGESEHNFEQLLTCFHRASRLKNIEVRQNFLQMIAKKFLSINIDSLHEFYLLRDAMPEIIRNQHEFAGKIISYYSAWSMKFEQDMRANLFWSELARLRYTRESFQAFLHS